MKIIIFILMLFTGIIQSMPLDTNVFKYMPLQAGNVWVYHYSYRTYPWSTDSGSGFARVHISDTTILNSKTFYIHSTSVRVINGYNNACIRPFVNKPIRVDSESGKIMVWEYCSENSQEYMIDSLFSRLNDSANNCNNIYNRFVCTDTSSSQIFSLTKPSIEFTNQGIEAGASWRYTKDIGLTSFGYGSLHYYCGCTLMGCVINGIVYGDTNMLVGIQQISTGIPEQFSLSQNYPNPFNPSTKIRFEISGTTAANTYLSVYDLLGREIAILVNEELNPGTYEAEWNAEAFSSGIYYYKLTAGDPSAGTGEVFTETKKMVLVK